MLLGAIGWAGVAATAYAGGPTSVLMTNPGDGRASALYIANPDYDRLYAAVGDEASGDLERHQRHAHRTTRRCGSPG